MRSAATCDGRWPRPSRSTPASSAPIRSLRTPLAFAELNPPDDPQIVFYREPKAPDLNLTVDDVDAVDDAVVAEVPILWVSAGALSAEPSRSTVHALLQRRDRRPHTVVDLDWRPQLWDGPASASR